MNDPKEAKLNQAFADICEGYSTLSLDKREVYLKHFTFSDQRLLDRFYGDIFQRAKERGLPTNEESLKFLAEEGLWTDKDEREISTQTLYLSNLEKTKANLILESQKKQLQKDIDAATVNIERLREQKQGLLNNTCESYAQNKLNNEVLYLSLYGDREFKQSFFSREEFGDLAPSNLAELLLLYNDKTSHLNPDVLKRLAIQGLFTNYFNIVAENPQDFFREPVHRWTFYQVNLINYGKLFNNIFQNISDIPESIKEDPDALLEFAQSSSKRREALERSSNADSYSIVGATDEDLKHLGVEKSSQKTLGKLAQEKGGSLDITDFADMFGK